MSTTSGAIKERAGSTNTLLVVLLLVAIAVAAVDFFLLNKKNGEEAKAVELTTEIQVASQRIAKKATEAAGGNPTPSPSWRPRAIPSTRTSPSFNKGDAQSGMPAYADVGGVQKPGGRADSRPGSRSTATPPRFSATRNWC